MLRAEGLVPSKKSRHRQWNAHSRDPLEMVTLPATLVDEVMIRTE